MIRSYVLVWSFVFCRIASRMTDIGQLGNGEAFIWLSWVGPLIVRPSIEVGAAIGFTSSRSAAIQSGSLTEVLFGPGITILYPWDQYFIGGEGRADLVTGDGVSAILIAGTFGLRF